MGLIDPQGPGHLRQGGQQRAIDGGQATQEVGVFALFQGQGLLCKFANDGLQRVGIKDTRGFAERSQRGAAALELLAYFGHATGALQSA